MDDSLSLVIPELHGSKIRRTADGRFSVYDLIRICGGVKNAHQFWNGNKSKKDSTHQGLAERFPEITLLVEFYTFPGKGRNTTLVGNVDACLQILGLLPGTCGQAYREKAANIVRRYIEGDADLGAELIIRDHNIERVERAKKRLLVCETNKQVAQMASSSGLSHGLLHNDRYQGLYEKTAQQLREEVGITDKKSPLNRMSVRDLAMNSMANILAIEAGDPNTLYDFASDIRDSYHRRIGKKLKPIFEEDILRPSQARSIAFGNYQLEIPVLVDAI
jgi:hypothetical protein